jgi:hypothetical protein
MFRLRAKRLALASCALLALSAVAGDFHAVTSTDKHWRPEGAQLTLGEALRIAEAEASTNHVVFSDFLTPSFQYSHDGKDYTWVFVYDGKVPAIGNHFFVFVNDRTRHAEFTPGK